MQDEGPPPQPKDQPKPGIAQKAGSLPVPHTAHPAGPAPRCAPLLLSQGQNQRQRSPSPYWVPSRPW